MPFLHPSLLETINIDWVVKTTSSTDEGAKNQVGIGNEWVRSY